MKKWEIQSELRVENGELRIEALVKILLENRGIRTKKEREDFLNPRLEDITPDAVGIDKKQLAKTIKRIKTAIEKKEQIVVFGDYDVDGITGTAILWETLHSIGANVLPYIPHRVEEGYGLSIKGIQNLESRIQNVTLVITVDNGIVAQEAVEFANKQGIDVIITDHHTVGEKLPDALAIVHTTKLCGAGVAWLLSQQFRIQNSEFKIEEDNHLELAALGTIADLVPLNGANRAIVKFGLERLCKTSRVGLQELYRQARIEKDIFGTYEVGHMIAPRLNASGRIESAMDSLRLLCTKDRARAKLLAEKLELINKERQFLMRQAAEHAISGVRNQESGIKKLLFVSHESYIEGVIGLVAGKLVEEFYRPSIVLSIGEKHSKASVRSVSGFNIIEFLRMHSSHFINVGGHPMAAGFTVETEKISILQETLESVAEDMLTEDLLIRSLKIDCEIPLSIVTQKIYKELQQLAPFGMGNPEPVFVSRKVTIVDMRRLGKEANHLKLFVRQDNVSFEAIGFGMARQAEGLHIGDAIDIAYTIDENTWNGSTKLQLKLKDVQAAPAGTRT